MKIRCNGFLSEMVENAQDREVDRDPSIELKCRIDIDESSFANLDTPPPDQKLEISTKVDIDETRLALLSKKIMKIFWIRGEEK